MTPANANPRLTPERLERKAVVYLRQSSPYQVQHNLESQHLQYALAERARTLGWTQVELIDADLGWSASLGAPPREGFERLLAAVALGEVLAPPGPAGHTHSSRGRKSLPVQLLVAELPLLLVLRLDHYLALGVHYPALGVHRRLRW